MHNGICENAKNDAPDIRGNGKGVEQMADTIRIDTEALKDISAQIGRIRSSLESIAGDVSRSVTEVRRVASGQDGIIGKMERTRRNTGVTAKHAERLARALYDSALLWEQAERSIMNNRFPDAGDGRSEGGAAREKTGNPVFNPDSGRKKYGSDQGSPRYDTDNYQAFKDLIEKNTGKRFKSNSDLKKYLSKMNNEGCGYAAMVNTIISQYEGRPADFKRDFGYDMYDSNGDPNFNLLMVDLYSATDNRNPDGSINKYEDFKWGMILGDGWYCTYDPWTDTTGSGTSIEERGQKIAYFLNQHGVSCDVETYQGQKLTVKQYERMINNGLVEHGQVSIRVSGDPVIMRDANGNETYSFSGGHALTVTGTTENGLLRVSSWGKVYYIDPSDMGKDISTGYQIVQIKS